MSSANANLRSVQMIRLEADQPGTPSAPVLSIKTGRKLDPAVAERRREDRQLVDDILAGVDGSFERLHELYATRLYRFAVKRLGDATEAEDVVQDVFLEVHRCLASLEGRSALLTWMFGIAHHQPCHCLDSPLISSEMHLALLYKIPTLCKAPLF